mmetsp:Transcript_10443/g.18814  ORF Transcript_10443/g.18814 Transcript_10443/m.18814 type:complete len:208 (+) Transcript_10443:72-695(+)
MPEASQMTVASRQQRCARLVHRPLLKVLMLALLAQWVAHTCLQTFIGSALPRSASSSNRDKVRRAAGPPELPFGNEVQQVRFLGRLLNWSPQLGEASKAVEAQAQMPLGIRIEKEGEYFVITEVLSGGAAALGNLDVQEGNIIHYITTDVEGGGGKRIAGVDEFDSVEELSQGILANSDELVAMVVEKPDKGALGAADFLTSVTNNL